MSAYESQENVSEGRSLEVSEETRSSPNQPREGEGGTCEEARKETMKTCRKCGGLEEFYLRASGGIGGCKTCAKRRAREWEAAHPDRRLEIQKKWADQNRELIRARNKARAGGSTPKIILTKEEREARKRAYKNAWYTVNRERIAKRARERKIQWTEARKEKERICKRAWAQANKPSKETCRCYRMRYNAKHPDRRRESDRRYKLSNPKKVKAYTAARYLVCRDRLIARTKEWYANLAEYEKSRLITRAAARTKVRRAKARGEKSARNVLRMIAAATAIFKSINQ